MAHPIFPATVRSLPFSPVYERHKIFAFDLVFFLSKEYRTTWAPYGWSYYFVDPLSPWTRDLEEAARILLLRRQSSFMQKYRELVPPGTVGSPQVFADHGRRALQFCVNRKSQPDELFETMLYVGRLGVYFYENGVYEAPNYAVVEIGESLKYFMSDYGPGIFPALRDSAMEIIQKGHAPPSTIM